MLPELRFPEFKNDGEWEERKVIDAYDFKVTNSLSRENLNYIEGKIKNIHYGDIHTKFSTLFDINREIVPYINSNISIDKIKEENYCVEGDIVFADASEDINDVGKSIEIINLNNEKLISGLHTLLARKKTNSLAKGFGGYLFRSDGIRKQIQKEAQGSKVFGISASRISNIKITLPINRKEQQKIVDLLSSLDKIITEHTQKIEVLKIYKKGLMQDLFPLKNERIPKIRFPEFFNDGEWVDEKLGSLLLQKPEYGINAPAVPYSDKLPTYLRITDISEDGHFLSSEKVSVNKQVTRYNYLTDNDIVLARTGASVGKSYKYRKEDGELVFAGFLIRIKPDIDKLNSEFLFQFISTSNYWKWVGLVSARSGQPGINGTEYASMPIPLPPNIQEQQKIADCLSSLDEIITSQAKKIEHLKSHKKGLMQKLFPETEH